MINRMINRVALTILNMKIERLEEGLKQPRDHADAVGMIWALSAARAKRIELLKEVK